MLLILLVISAIAIFFFALLSLNQQIVKIDLLLIEIEPQLGELVLSFMMIGILIAVFLELIYFSSKRKNKSESN